MATSETISSSASTQSPALVSIFESQDYQQYLALEDQKKKLEDQQFFLNGKWGKPIIDAVLAAGKYIDGDDPGNGPILQAYFDIHSTITNNKNAWDRAHDFFGISEDDEVGLALAFGLVAGIAYASMTGAKITPPEFPTKEAEVAHV